LLEKQKRAEGRSRGDAPSSLRRSAVTAPPSLEMRAHGTSRAAPLAIGSAGLRATEVGGEQATAGPIKLL
jgi:hypothetical protein